MVAWGKDFGQALSSVGLGGSNWAQAGGDIEKAIQPLAKVGLIPFVGAKGGTSTGSTTTTDPATNNQALVQWLLGQIPNMGQQQLVNPTTQQQSALEGLIGQLPPDQAKQVMAALPQGQTITKDVQAALSPPGSGGGTTNDAMQMGLQMFFQQFMAPMLKNISDSNNTLINQYGNALQKSMAGPLPPGEKELLQAQTAQTQQDLTMQNQAGAMMAAGAGPFQELISGLGAETSAAQALPASLLHAITLGQTNLGNVSGIQALAQAAGIPASSLAGILLSSNAGNLLNLPSTSFTGQ